MRRLAVLALGLACASPGIPPGGPEDEDPPAVVRVTPDTNAVRVRAGSVGFSISEVVSERPQGGTTLADLFLISPSKGPVQLEWHRDRLEVRPRGGFRPNTTYRVTMLPGLTDLDGNSDSSGFNLVFSTGESIATNTIRGRVFDWMAEKPVRNALVEAFVLPDSSRYLAVSDSLGAYELPHMPTGTYVLRALVDQNRNRALDVRELYDTLTISLVDSASRDLLAIVRDTIGPGIERVDVVDSTTLRIKFDRALDTALVFDASSFSIKAGDSSIVAIRRALSSQVEKREKEDSVRTKQFQDSVRRAADTTGRDTTRADTARGAARPPTVARRTPAQTQPPRTARARTPADTTPLPRPKVKIPDQEIVLYLNEPLKPQTAFRIRANDMRSIVGRRRSSDRVINTPRAPRKAADSTGRSSGRDTVSLHSTGLSLRRLP